jgi:hypothetical protein
MSSAANTKTAIPNGLDGRVLARILEEGYGTGAWHGPDFKSALEDVSTELAFWRPAADRHNIAEIAVHHAYYLHSVRGRISSVPPEPFVMQGDDWFPLSDEKSLSWSDIVATVDSQHRRLVETVAGIAGGKVQPSLTESERFDLILGITCHAVYHAGQIQLIKKLRGE